MSELNLDELERLYKGASGNEWRSIWPEGSKQLCAGVESPGSHYVILHLDIDKSYHPDTVAMWKRDCDFIAAAHNKMPALISEARKSREKDARIAELEKMLEAR